MDFLSNIVQEIIKILYNSCASFGIESYGLAIIILTVIIKMALYPLTKQQIQSMKTMARLQPKVKAIQEKYKGDKMRANIAMQELYKAEKVNPLAGCLPLLVQMPILIGIFYGIRDFQYEGSAQFMGLEIAKSVMEIYTAGGMNAVIPYTILPILSVVTTFIQSKMSMPDTSATQNKMMLYGMPIFIGYISIGFPTGLVLYWVVMNVMQILQQLWIEKSSSK